MTRLSIGLPDSTYQKLKVFAAHEKVSVNQFIAIAASEKLSRVLSLEHLQHRARRANRADFERMLAAVPDVPDEMDHRPN